MGTAKQLAKNILNSKPGDVVSGLKFVGGSTMVEANWVPATEEEIKAATKADRSESRLLREPPTSEGTSGQPIPTANIGAKPSRLIRDPEESVPAIADIGIEG